MKAVIGLASAVFLLNASAAADTVLSNADMDAVSAGGATATASSQAFGDAVFASTFTDTSQLTGSAAQSTPIALPWISMKRLAPSTALIPVDIVSRSRFRR